MAVHDLKCWTEPFQAVLDGRKPFEWREDDRDYQDGDTLHLREFKPHWVFGAAEGEYTGRTIDVVVTYVIRGPQFGIPEGYCIMGIRHVLSGTSSSEGEMVLVRADDVQTFIDASLGDEVAMAEVESGARERFDAALRGAGRVSPSGGGTDDH